MSSGEEEDEGKMDERPGAKRKFIYTNTISSKASAIKHLSPAV